MLRWNRQIYARCKNRSTKINFIQNNFGKLMRMQFHKYQHLSCKYYSKQASVNYNRADDWMSASLMQSELIIICSLCKIDTEQQNQWQICVGWILSKLSGMARIQPTQSLPTQQQERPISNTEKKKILKFLKNLTS